MLMTEKIKILYIYVGYIFLKTFKTCNNFVEHCCRDTVGTLISIVQSLYTCFYITVYIICLHIIVHSSIFRSVGQDFHVRPSLLYQLIRGWVIVYRNAHIYTFMIV